MDTRAPGGGHTKRELFSLTVAGLLFGLIGGPGTPATAGSTTEAVVNELGPASVADVVPAVPARGPLVVHAVGDVNVDPSYIPALRTHGYGHAWSGLGGLFLIDDVTIINLECAVSDLGSAVPKEFNFRCDPEALPAMREAGVDVASLANNHSGDYGPDAVVDSRQNLVRAGIAPVGAGRNESEAYAAAIIEANGWTVAVLGFGGVIPDFSWIAGPDRPGMTHGRDLPKMLDAIRSAKEIADLVFVTIHWGRELDTEPTADLIERGHAMIDAGADGIFGHHSHRLKPMTWYADRPIAWGLGNFVWPKLSEAGSRTAVAEVVAHPDGRFAACLIPAYIESHGHPVLGEPYTGPCLGDFAPSSGQEIASQR